MRFDASLKELQKAIKDLEKASKKAVKSKKAGVNTNQIDMFAMPAASNDTDLDVDALKSKLDEAISSVETILKESA